jgi:hypothetical protein
MHPCRRHTDAIQETRMRTNEGTADRAVRAIAGAALIGLAATQAIGAWGYAGGVPLLTGAVGLCPSYSLPGIKPCSLGRR